DAGEPPRAPLPGERRGTGSAIGRTRGRGRGAADAGLGGSGLRLPLRPDLERGPLPGAAAEAAEERGAALSRVPYGGAGPEEGGRVMSIQKRGRYWAVYDAAGELVCLCVYLKGAREVIRRLEERRSGNREEAAAASAVLPIRLPSLGITYPVRGTIAQSP